MPRSRRELLRAMAGSSAFLLAGCGGEGIEYRVPEETGMATRTRTDRSRRDDGIAERSPRDGAPDRDPPGRTDTRSQGSGVGNPQLEAATDAIVAELDWFANEYQVVTHRCLGRANRIRRTLEGFQDPPQLSQYDIDRVDELTTGYNRLLRESLDPHFPTATVDALVSASREYVRDLKTFAGRGDLDAVQRELGKLETHYERLSRPQSFRREFPDFPIQSPLFDDLTAESRNPATTFVVSAPETDFTTVVRNTASLGPRSRAVGSVGNRDRQRFYDRQTALFSGTDVSADRTDRKFFNVHLASSHVALSVQQFRDRQSAASAYTSLLNSPVFVEGTETVGDTEWNRGYYFQGLTFENARLQHRYLVSDADGTIIYEEKRRTEKPGRQLAIQNGFVMHDHRGNVIYDGDGAMPEDHVSAGTPDEGGDIVYVYLTKVGRFLITANPSLVPWDQQPDEELLPLRQTWLYRSS